MVVDLSKLCGKIRQVPLVTLPDFSGIIVTHRKEDSPHVCTLKQGHVGKHRCGQFTNEIWDQYCHYEW